MWTQLITAAIGIWLMLSPALFEYGPPLATSDWIVGPLIASFGLIAAWEITRALRNVNVVLAAWVVLAPFVVPSTPGATANHVVCGIAIALLSLRRGRTQHAFAGGWRSLLERTP